MASLSPDSCCYKGVKHDGVAKGKLSQIAGIEAYSIYPENQSTEKAILMCVFDYVVCSALTVFQIDRYSWTPVHQHSAHC